MIMSKQPKSMVAVIVSFKKIFAHIIPVNGTINTTVEALTGPVLFISVTKPM